MAFQTPELNSIQYLDVIKIVLNQEGFRLTQQRQKILDAFQDVPEGHHLSAEEIFRKLSAQGETIGISTIYRALHLLVKLGLVRELALSEGRKQYEFNTPLSGEHHHLVCVRCGRVQEFEEPLVTKVGSQEAVTRGFSLLNCQFILYVMCSDCCDATAGYLTSD